MSRRLPVLIPAAVLAAGDEHEPDPRLAQDLFRARLRGDAPEELDLFIADLHNVRDGQPPEHFALRVREVTPEGLAQIRVECDELARLFGVVHRRVGRAARRFVRQRERAEVQNFCLVDQLFIDFLPAELGVRAGLAAEGKFPVAGGVERDKGERGEHIVRHDHALRADARLRERAAEKSAERVCADLAEHRRPCAEFRQRSEEIRRRAAGVRRHDGVAVRVGRGAGKVNEQFAQSNNIVHSVSSCFRARGSFPERAGIFSAFLHGAHRAVDRFQILAIRYAVPFFAAGEHLHTHLAALKLILYRVRQVKLALLRVLPERLAQERRELLPHRVHKRRRKAPEVHRHRRAARKRLEMLAVLGKFGVVAALENFRALHDRPQAAVLHLAHAARDRAVLGNGVAQMVAHERVLVRVGILLEELIDEREGFRAVVVVGIDDRERHVDHIAAARHGVRRAPRLSAPLRHGKALRQDVQRLVHILHEKIRRDAVAAQSAQLRLHLGLDDKHHPPEAGAVCVKQRKIENKIALVVHRRHLLQPAEAAAHARRQNDQDRLFLCHNTHLSPFVVISIIHNIPKKSNLIEVVKPRCFI